jgi:hypothetical protein
MSVRAHTQNTQRTQKDDKKPGTSKRANQRKVKNGRGNTGEEQLTSAERYSRDVVEKTHLDAHGFAFVLRGFGCDPSIGTRYMGRGKQTYVSPKSASPRKPNQRRGAQA